MSSPEVSTMQSTAAAEPAARSLRAVATLRQTRGFRVAMTLVMGLALVAAVRPALSGVRPASPEGQRWALLVAVDAYSHDRIPSADGREAAAREIAEVLVSRYGFDRDRVIELYGESATNKAIRRILWSLGDRLQSRDTLVAVFGLLSLDAGSGGRETFVAPFDANPEDAWTMIPAAELVASISDLPLASTLVAFDGCASAWDPEVRSYHDRKVQQVEPSAKSYSTAPFRDAGAREILTTCGFRKWLRPAQVEQAILDWLLEGARPGVPRTSSELRTAIQRKIDGKVELTVYGSGDRYWFLAAGMENNDLDMALDRGLSDKERSAAIDRLARAVGSGDADIPSAFRSQVTGSLAQLAHDDAEPLSLRQQATLALANVPTDERLEILSDLAASDGPIELRYTALRALGLLPREQAIAGYETLLNDDDPAVVSSSVRSLTSLEATGSIDRLSALLASSTDSEVLTTTIAALDLLTGDDFDLTAPMLEIASRNDVEPRVLVSVVDTLATRGDSRSLPLMLDLASSSSVVDVRAAAVFALGRFDRSPQATEVMLAALRDDHASVREGAAFVLGSVKERSALRPLIRLLRDPDEEDAVRTAAASSLGELENPNAIPALRRAATTGSAQLRATAIASLGRLGADKAFSDLVRVATNERNRAVRSEAVTALQRILEATSFEGAAAESALADPSPEVRAAALDWLGKSKNPSWLPAFHGALADDDERVRAVASKGLAMLGTTDAVEQLDSGLASADADKRHRALWSLGVAASPAALEALLRYQPPEEDQRTYISALGNYTDDRAAERVMEYTASSRSSVALVAADALRQQSLGRLEEGDVEGALRLGQTALDVHRKILGEGHPDVAGDLNNLGVMYQELGNWRAAAESLQQALHIREKVFGGSDPAVATTLSNLGAVYVRSGAPEKGLEYLQRSLQIREFAFGRESPETSGTLREIADALEQMGDHDRAAAYRERAEGAAIKTRQPGAASNK